MNIIDFMLALIFFCAVGFYAYKLHKKRVKMRMETTKSSTPDHTPDCMADSEIARVLAQVPQVNPRILGALADNPALTAAGTARSIGSTGVNFCKLIPIKLTGIPDGLPFGESYDSSDFNKSLMTAGYEVNEELKNLNSLGLTVLNVAPLLLSCDMLVLCITAGKTGTAGTETPICT